MESCVRRAYHNIAHRGGGIICVAGFLATSRFHQPLQIQSPSSGVSVIASTYCCQTIDALQATLALTRAFSIEAFLRVCTHVHMCASLQTVVKLDRATRRAETPRRHRRLTAHAKGMSLVGGLIDRLLF